MQGTLGACLQRPNCQCDTAGVRIATGGLLVAATTLLAAGCGDDQLSSSTDGAPSTSSSAVLSATTSPSRSPPTLSTTSSTQEAADPVADILAAAAAHFLSVGERATLTTLHVVDRLGTASSPEMMIRFGDDSPPMTDVQRHAIESALTPREIIWTHDLESVGGTAMTVPAEQAVVMFAEPAIEGGRAEVGANLWCGMLCGGGIGLRLEQSSTDEWIVTDEFGGYVA